MAGERERDLDRRVGARALRYFGSLGWREAISAIGGIFYFDGRPVDQPVLESMVESLAHRGPDGAGVWGEGSIGLGHRMLWTTPESLREELPLAGKGGDLVITADARIDNRDELIASLGITGCPHGDVADSELILGAYEKWGERCPETLVGDFAFAIWDRRRQTLFCARDHMGVKPLYYYRSGRALVFASEIKALFCVPEVPRRLNEVRVVDYLERNLEDKRSTFYKDVFRLPPACSMTAGRKGVSVRPYWSLDPSHEVRFLSDEEYAEAFRELFTEAVRCRLRSAFPVGSHLSGGLDSSSVVCVARELSAEEKDQPLHTFSAVFKEVPECDESDFIEAVLAQGGLEPHFVRADRLSPLGDLEHVLWHQDGAFWAPNLYVERGLNSAAHQQGVRILLGGDDGDVTVSHGTEYLAELARRGRWATLNTELAMVSRRSALPYRSILLSYVLKPLAPRPVRWVWQVLRGRNRNVTSIVNRDLARRVGLKKRHEALPGEQPRPPRTARDYHWHNLSAGLHPYMLGLLDKAAAEFSIEHRHPFWDRRLMEFCLALPTEQKLSWGWNRAIMRRAMANCLPEKIRWRPDKGDLSANAKRNILRFERRLLEEIILGDPQVIEAYVDIKALREAYHRYVSSGTSEDTMHVWSAVTLAVWLRQTGMTA